MTATLYAVKVVAYGGVVTTVFPAEDENDATESAGRINDWVAGYHERHPENDIGGIHAEVVVWVWDPIDHAYQLAQFRKAEGEHEEM